MTRYFSVNLDDLHLSGRSGGSSRVNSRGKGEEVVIVQSPERPHSDGGTWSSQSRRGSSSGDLGMHRSGSNLRRSTDFVVNGTNT